MATELKKNTQVVWRRFLSSPEGIEGMLYLREAGPRVTKGDQASIIFESGVAEGYQRALDKLKDTIAREVIAVPSVENIETLAR